MPPLPYKHYYITIHSDLIESHMLSNNFVAILSQSYQPSPADLFGTSTPPFQPISF
jgi:hypothetical protein